MEKSLRFLNTDLELLSQQDLTPLVNAFGEDVVVLYNGSWGKYFKASFETSYNSSGDPNEVIQHFFQLITSLNQEEKELYHSCFSKLFDVGFESGGKARQTHDFFNKFGRILLPRDRSGARWPICVMNSIKSVGKVA